MSKTAGYQSIGIWKGTVVPFQIIAESARPVNPKNKIKKKKNKSVLYHTGPSFVKVKNRENAKKTPTILAGDNCEVLVRS